jgi:hypothetical protein
MKYTASQLVKQNNELLKQLEKDLQHQIDYHEMFIYEPSAYKAISVMLLEIQAQINTNER